MRLLSTTRPSELPTDALLARLRYRRAAIDNTQGETIEASLSDLIDWVYRRLNNSMRQRLEPFLDVLAMRHLVLELRYHLVEEIPPKAPLRRPLLAAPLKRLLASSLSPAALVTSLEESLVNDYPFAAGLARNYLQQGPGGVEQQLAGGILGHSRKRAKNRTCRSVLRYLIDMRNLLVIKKFWRWQVNLAPSLVAGGSFSTEILQRIWATHDEARLTVIATRLSGVKEQGTQATGLEKTLLLGLTRLLRRIGRDPLGLGVCIEYLWRAQLSQHNKILERNLSPERQDLLEEMLL